VDAQPPRCREEGARARDRLWRVLGWLDEDRQLCVGGTSSLLYIPTITLLTALFRPPGTPTFSSSWLYQTARSLFPRTTTEEEEATPTPI